MIQQNLVAKYEPLTICQMRGTSVLLSFFKQKAVAIAARWKVALKRAFWWMTGRIWGHSPCCILWAHQMQPVCYAVWHSDCPLFCLFWCPCISYQCTRQLFLTLLFCHWVSRSLFLAICWLFWPSSAIQKSLFKVNIRVYFSTLAHGVCFINYGNDIMWQDLQLVFFSKFNFMLFFFV